MNQKNLWQMLKFTLFSISAGVIQIGSFTLLNEIFKMVYWPAYLISLVLSILWNFTLNRRYTFKSATNVPIAMAKELIETRNKQQLMRNPYVVRVAHTRNWVNLVENGIKKVCSRVGMDVEFDKENTDIWSQKVKDNYDQLLMSR